jgi:allophanate hydrolase subunit 2
LSLEILELYGVATIQGLPNPGLRGYGVPTGGAFDSVSFAIANGLLDNDPGSPCIELAMAAMRVRALEPTCLAWVGAGAFHGTWLLNAGDEFAFDAPDHGCRSYLALPGGVQVEGPLGRGTVIQSRGPFVSLIRRLPAPPRSLHSRPLRVVSGPQAGLLPLDTFLHAEFTVSRILDRMGVRLEPSPELHHTIELPSELATVGAIQITPDGTPIILGPDGPTIGGYPKIAVVIRADIARVGQLRPDVPVRFQIVSIDEARVIGNVLGMG